MFLDASAIVAILLREPGHEHLIASIDGHAGPKYSSPLARFEASVSLARALLASEQSRRPTQDEIDRARDDVNALLSLIEARDVVINGGIGQIAIDAAGLYGNVVGHPAALNFCDCFSYACAKSHRLRLLSNNDGFTQTDIG